MAVVFLACLESFDLPNSQFPSYLALSNTMCVFDSFMRSFLCITQAILFDVHFFISLYPVALNVFE